ncbi:MAG: polysaccharide deacetylase family protein [Clostridia bacterium]|nr:polysaccharide deacetylase family protein [Clostridia bacterium]
MLIVTKKRTLFTLIVALITAVALTITLAVSGVVSASAKEKRLIPIYSVDVEKNVALTFDCAWGATKTRSIMDEVEKHGYKCTFFVTGFWVDANPELIKEICSRGHQIGNHSENHPHLSKVDKEILAQEIDLVNAKIERLTGIRPTCFRAPFGEYDNRLMKALRERNIYCIQWSVDSLDWKGIGGKEITERVVNRLKSGDIVLFHNDSDHVLDALPLVLGSVKNKGLNAVRVDELIYKDNYVIDGQGKQTQNA